LPTSLTSKQSLISKKYIFQYFALIFAEMDFENDPAADFLNREREELAGIINENEGELNFSFFVKICSYQL
jgi:hypothetical protein